MAFNLLSRMPGVIGATSRELDSVFARRLTLAIRWRMLLSGLSQEVRVMVLLIAVQRDMMPTVAIAMLFSQLLRLELGSR